MSICLIFKIASLIKKIEFSSISDQFGWSFSLYLLLVCLFVYLFICLFVSNKRQNGWTDRASRDPRKGLWMIEFSKICLLHKIRFVKILKIRKICLIKSVKFLFYNLNKENMFTMEMKDGREAPEKQSIYLNRTFKR